MGKINIGDILHTIDDAAGKVWPAIVTAVHDDGLVDFQRFAGSVIQYVENAIVVDDEDAARTPGKDEERHTIHIAYPCPGTAPEVTADDAAKEPTPPPAAPDDDPPIEAARAAAPAESSTSST